MLSLLSTVTYDNNLTVLIKEFCIRGCRVEVCPGLSEFENDLPLGLVSVNNNLPDDNFTVWGIRSNETSNGLSNLYNKQVSNTKVNCFIRPGKHGIYAICEVYIDDQMVSSDCFPLNMKYQKNHFGAIDHIIKYYIYRKKNSQTVRDDIMDIGYKNCFCEQMFLFTHLFDLKNLPREIKDYICEIVIRICKWDLIDFAKLWNLFV